MKLRLSEDYVIDTDDYRRGEGLRIAILAMSGHKSGLQYYLFYPKN